MGAQLYKASKKGDVGAVKKLLARPDVDVNYAHKVRERVWAARAAWEEWNGAKRHGMEVIAAL